ncbi:MAG TPA: TIGR02996 domain-containing protein, partial [Gemmataceae bacterium]|nr:TIGR02996 domain-containing protein [Gemmataceae bacterium]
MTDDAFLRAIIEDPDDDAPRLIYADWLEERGDPRGEFIRIQCELARRGAGDTARLRARERKLADAHARDWLGPLRDMQKNWVFRRGFIDEFDGEARKFIEQGALLCRLHPVRR